MTEKFFMEIVFALIACLVALLAFIWNAHMKQHHEINAILKQMAETKAVCLATFAKRSDVAELGGRVSVMEKIKTGGE